MSNSRTPDSTQKAFEINHDRTIYGTFAEIGAGQEVVRHFFKAGGAAGTIAKSMSAYDMTVSDAIYGKSSRYVSYDRLVTMMTRELDMLQERLAPERGKDTRFFAFADTVAAKSFNATSNADSHGWLGIRFQDRPGREASQVIMHVQMNDQTNLQQQEALGRVGVNLIYACYNYSGDREKFILSLLDNLSPHQIEIDVLEIKGNAFNSIDPRIWSLELVKQGFCKAIFFDDKGKIHRPKDAFYGKHIALCRGSYRPPTKLNLDMLDKGLDSYKNELKSRNESVDNVLLVPEISMNKLRERGKVINEDFLARVDLLLSLGKNVLISNYKTYGDISQYVQSCTKSQIGFILGFYNLEEIFDELQYDESYGGLLAGLGHIVGQRGRLFVYPAGDESQRKPLRIDDSRIAKEQMHLIRYLQDKNYIFDVEKYDPKVFHIWSRVVLRMIQDGESGWEEMVPPSISESVKSNCLFGYPCEVGPPEKSK